jgi:hypothetical protein
MFDRKGERDMSEKEKIMYEALKAIVDCFGVGWKYDHKAIEALAPLIRDAQQVLAQVEGTQS